MFMHFLHVSVATVLLLHQNTIRMSQAFMREGEDQWLTDVAPSIHALILFLTRENNGVRVYEQKNFTNPQGRIVHVMNNGLSYTKDDKEKWEIIGTI